MKTIEELYKEILADPELKVQCVEAIKAGKQDEFLKSQGCEATAEDVKAFFESKKEVSVDELDTAAGGCNDNEAIMSACTFGFSCLGLAIYSATEDDLGKGLYERDMGEGTLLC